MGAVRFLLAITVAIGHCGVAFGVGGKNSVQLFFMISGFLISYIIVGNERYKSIKAFYINRFLRIYPLYLVVASLSLLLEITISLTGHKSSFISAFQDAPLLAQIGLAASNLLIFGQDWAFFIGVQNGHLGPIANFMTSQVPLYQGILVGPAWSLALELSFYVIAPFILKRRPRILVFYSLAIIARAVLVLLGIGLNDPWIYRFFPTELATFLFGALVQQLWQPRFAKFAETTRHCWSYIGLVVFPVALVVYNFVPARDFIKNISLFILLALFIPALFEFQSRNKFDKYLGELSYPIYIWHMLVITAASLMSQFSSSDSQIQQIVYVIPAVLALSALSNRLIEKPINRIRFGIRGEKMSST